MAGKSNQDWFEQFLNDIVLSIVGGIACGQLPQAKGLIEDYLGGLELHKELTKSPLVKVTALDDETITFLVRGEFPFFKGSCSAFMRIEVQIAKKLIEKIGTLNIDIREWITVIGDLKISKEKLFEARLAFGYDESSGHGVFMGAGALKIIPAGFGVDLLLGGLDDRGAVVGLKIESPVAIPLGTTGLGLKAIGGDFAYNFVARLDYAGQPIPNPTAANYVDWAANTGIDKWKPGPVDITAVGVGIRCDIVTMADQGRAIRLKDAGVAVLTPGPVFILGGEGYAMMGIATAKGFMVVDINSASIAIGLGASVLIPPKEGSLVSGSGQLDALFSFSDPSLWYLHFGRDDNPVNVQVLKGLFGASIFYMVDNHAMFFGAGVWLGWDWSIWKFRVYAKGGIEVRNKIGWNPALFEAYFKAWVEMGIEVWIIKLALKAAAAATGIVADPCKLQFDFTFTIDLPWPIPDIEFETCISYSDEHPQPPVLSLVLADAELIANSALVKMEKLGAIHPISGRQWLLGAEKAWPDLEIVVPFRCRLIDATPAADRIVVGAAVSSQNQGGYDISHELSEVTLEDTINHKKVAVHGVWASANGGETARLHLLGQDPYSWLLPHITPGSTTPVEGLAAGLQFFGHGSKETFQAERRFAEMLIKPQLSADLITDYAPALKTRVLACDKFQLRFATTADTSIHVDQVELLVVTSERNPALINYVIEDTASTAPLAITKCQDLYGEIFLGAAKLPVGQPVDTLWLASATQIPILLYGVRYRERRKAVQTARPKQVLAPGKYKLTVKGKSSGKHPDPGLPPCSDLSWEFDKDFEVVYPERLRPYIRYTTLGDRRIFGKEAHAWNPSMYGYGFPHYRGYQGVVRFFAPYMSKIFSGQDAITIRLDYDNRTAKPAHVEQKVSFAANTEGASSAPQMASDWISANAGAQISLVDEEIVFSKALQNPGPVHLSIWFTPPFGTAVKLDEWTAYVSQFAGFQQHLAWSGKCLQTTYDSVGKTTRPVSITLQARFTTSGIQQHVEEVPDAAASAESASLLGVEYPFVVPGAVLPVEYTTVPPGWELPAALDQHLRPLDAHTGLRFARFARDSGSQFDDGTPTAQSCLNQLAASTTVEALADASGRLYALWLRTPEPVDWRRVKGTLRINHTASLGSVPVDYANRWPLDLELSILPSPDAASAFLVGRFAGSHCLLPRGEYELTLSFDPYQAGLDRLRPGAGINAPETAFLKFMQPCGKEWPLPPQGVIAFKKPGH